MINPDFLSTFVDLSQTKSFTQTAKNLSMTQPGVSQHLKSLESYFGSKLVERFGKSFELTEAGSKVLGYAQQLFSSHRSLLNSLERDDPHSGVCRMASPGSFGIYMYSFLLKLAQSHPKLIMHFAYAPNATVVAEVLGDLLDVGFVSIKPDTHELAMKKIDQEKLCLVVPKSFRGTSFESLKGLGFINHPDGFYHSSRLLAENFPTEFQGMQEFKITGHINQVTRILEPVAMGTGFSALPEYALKAFPDLRNVKILNLKKQVVDPIYMIHRKHRKLPARYKFVMTEFKRVGSS